MYVYMYKERVSVREKKELDNNFLFHAFHVKTWFFSFQKELPVDKLCRNKQTKYNQSLKANIAFLRSNKSLR